MKIKCICIFDILLFDYATLPNQTAIQPLNALAQTLMDLTGSIVMYERVADE